MDIFLFLGSRKKVREIEPRIGTVLEASLNLRYTSEDLTLDAWQQRL
jgi:hypothetical protein